MITAAAKNQLHNQRGKKGNANHADIVKRKRGRPPKPKLPEIVELPVIPKRKRGRPRKNI